MLELTNVTKSFDGEPALEDITLTVPEKAFLCILGPNRCGKSTLLRLIAGLDTPTGGRILLDGQPVVGPGPERGLVFQEYALFPWRTVTQNITFGLELKGLAKAERQLRAQHYLDVVGLQEFADYHPRNLSGGTKQLVAIVRALANDPAIILMDEPFGALDAQTRNVMQERLLDVWQQERKTILFVTHSVDEAVFLADQIVVMSYRPGHILEQVTVDLSRPRVRTSSNFNSLRNHLLHTLHDEVMRGLNNGVPPRPPERRPYLVLPV